MRLFALSDLHLSLGGDKPMDVFGPKWEAHHVKIKKNWMDIVSKEDTVVLGGDLSWAMSLEEAKADFFFIHQLPGFKVIFKGNHDYWWQSYNKITRALPRSIYPVQNNYYPLKNREDIALCGTRGWTAFSVESSAEHDEKIFRRELIRLELSLSRAYEDGYHNIIVTLHYPPFTPPGEDTAFIDIMKRYNVKICIYGHLHGEDHQKALIGEREGIICYFTSCDYLDFKPVEIDLSVFKPA